MFNFFHGIVGKIAIGISSITLLFSGTAANHPIPSQDVASSSLSLAIQKASSTNQLSETEQLKKEVNDLKKQLNVAGKGLKNIEVSNSSSVLPSKPVAVKKSSSIIPADQENFKESLVLIYSKSAEGIKRTIDANKTDLIDLSNRRSHLSNLLNATRSVSFPNSGDGQVLNQMFSIFGDSYASEIKFIDDNTSYINSNITYLNQIYSFYQTAINQLLAGSNNVISRDEFITKMQEETNITSENTYKAEKNILTALQNHYSNVIKKEDEYTASIAVIKSALAKVSTSIPNPNVNYYQPMPQNNYGLTARQELLLNPIQCKINYDSIQATVSCY